MAVEGVTIGENIFFIRGMIDWGGLRVNEDPEQQGDAFWASDLIPGSRGVIMVCERLSWKFTKL